MEEVPHEQHKEIKRGTLDIINTEQAKMESVLVKMKSWRPIVIIIAVLCVVSLVLIPLAFFISGAYILVYLAIQKTLKKMKFLQQYASSRNLQVGDNLTSGTVTGRLLQQNDREYKKLFLHSNYKEFPTKLFYFNYSVGNKNKTTYHFTICEITIEHGVFPYILLQRKDVMKHQNSDYFGTDKDTEVTIGSHDTTYSLYTTSRYETEALQICTPEFIELIKSSYLPLCVEFVNDRLYIYVQSSLETEKDLDELYRVTHAVIDKFGDFLVRMKDDYQALHEVYTREVS